MSVKLEDYIPVEEGVAKWLYGLWSKEAQPLLARLEKDVEAGNYDDAYRAVNSIDVQSIAQGAAKGLENHAVAALTFGAMFAKQSDKILYIDKPLPPIIPSVVKMYQASFPRIQKTILQMLIRFFDKHEPTQKSEIDCTSCGLVEDLVTEIMKSDRLTLAQKLNAVVMGQARSAIDVAANLNTSRLVQLGYLQQSYVDGVTTYQITEVMDGRTCGVCRSMHGQTFSVSSGISRLMTILQMDDPDAVKLASPFPSQSAENVAKLGSMSQAQLENAGLQTPPYHPSCRGMTVPVGTVQTVTTTTVPTTEQFESVFANNAVEAAVAKQPEMVLAPNAAKLIDAALAEFEPKTSMSFFDPEAVAVWNEKIGMEPSKIVDIMTDGLPYKSGASGLYNVDGKFQIKFSLVDDAGDRVGSVKRNFYVEGGALKVEHDFFRLEDSVQGAGVAKRLLANSMELYQRLGVERVTMMANIDVGGYAWAKYGFMLEDAGDLPLGIKSLMEQVTDPDVLAVIENILANKTEKSIWNIADLTYEVKFDGRKMPLGKAALLGTHWNGYLSLGDQEAMLRFMAYIGRKK